MECTFYWRVNVKSLKLEDGALFKQLFWFNTWSSLLGGMFSNCMINFNLSQINSLLWSDFSIQINIVIYYVMKICNAFSIFLEIDCLNLVAEMIYLGRYTHILS